MTNPRPSGQLDLQRHDDLDNDDGQEGRSSGMEASTLDIDAVDEEVILSRLHKRYSRDQIYTYVGPVLLSVNPFKKVTLYHESIKSAYCCWSEGKNVFSMPPHLYAIVGHVMSILDQFPRQAIVITGESSSGKTQSSNFCLEFLLSRWNGRRKTVENVIISEKLMDVNVILESFGHSRTTQNDNSTRFMKFLEIELDADGVPVGGVINSFMLEKSRVTSRNNLEDRSFHIFYQLMACPDPQLLKSLKLQRPFQHYHALRTSSTSNIDMDDRNNFLVTTRSFNRLGFTEPEVDFIFKCLASILKLSNLSFSPKANMDGTIGSTITNEFELLEVAELLSVTYGRIETALTTKSIIDDVSGQVLTIDACPEEAADTVDFILRSFYGRVFSFVVKHMNDLIKGPKTSDLRSVGILDMFGFEVLDDNRLEQVLVNYANERLHSVYVESIFRLTQEDFRREAIDWSTVDYFDNGNIIDLLDKSPFGVLPLLDQVEWSGVADADLTYLVTLTGHCHESPYFEADSCKQFLVPKVTSAEVIGPCNASSTTTSPLPVRRSPRLDASLDNFWIRHFAGTVTYSVAGIVKKNNGRLYPLWTQAMYASKDKTIRSLFPEGDPKTAQVRLKSKKRPTSQGVQAKVSLDALVKNLKNRKCHFIQCIRPNELHVANMFEEGLVLHQIRYLLLTEATKLYKNGFAHSWTYEDFLRRYNILCPSTSIPSLTGLPAEGVVRIIREFSSSLASEFSVGRTKIFVRTLKTWHLLEEMRNKKLAEKVLSIQSFWRMFVRRRQFFRIKASQEVIIRSYRRWKMRILFNNIIKNLPTISPIDKKWPPTPSSMAKTSKIIYNLYHVWRCRKYRDKFDETSRNRMREKLTASLIFRDRKISYPKSVGHPFLGDYIRLRQNVKWKKMASASGDGHLVFADIVNKASKTGKFSQKIIVLSMKSMFVLDQRTLQVKYRVPIVDIVKVILSPNSDDIFVHVAPSIQSKSVGTFLFESAHVIELVTKMFLVIQNVTSRILTIEFEDAIHPRVSILGCLDLQGYEHD